MAILGSTGMLGSTLTRVFQHDFGSVLEVNRSGVSITGSNQAISLDVLKKYSLQDKLVDLKIDYVVNAIGMIKQVIDEENPSDIADAVKINTDFALQLNKISSNTGIRVIQIGTDCVYSGLKGSYSEDSLFDPVDVYGKTKLMGEQASNESMLIRTSILGKELLSSVSLLEWVLTQPVGAKINGFTNHLWNGVTTMHFSKVVSGIISADRFIKGITHLVPNDCVSKYELVKLISAEFGRTDLEISPFPHEKAIDRTLVTKDPNRNLHMWEGAGYNSAPNIRDMVSEYAYWTKHTI